MELAVKNVKQYINLIVSYFKRLILMKIAVAGTGYVGLSISILLAKQHQVTAVDIIPERIELINKRNSPIKDEYIEEYLKSDEINLTATTDEKIAYIDAEYVIIAVPTSYDIEKNAFDTHHIEDVIESVLSVNNHAIIVIKSTIPVGYTSLMRNKYSNASIIFSPEFLREGHALYDNLYPSRIIVGYDKSNNLLEQAAYKFANIINEAAIQKNTPILFMNSTEAEAVKLFANSYLALRVAYFNELDTYAETHNLDTKSIIEGVGLDSRIGTHYNNPSFGYGGYCLPKDTRQLLANYKDIPQNLISATIDSNDTRKRHIINSVLKKLAQILDNKKSKMHKTIPVIGVYRIVMKSGSDNFRQSSIQDIIEGLHKSGAEIIVYEPLLGSNKTFHNYKVVNDINVFKEMADTIITNRYDNRLDDIKNKVYTRDVFNMD